jgi:hypothetical protein
MTSKAVAVARKIRIGGTLVPYDDAAQEVSLERTNIDILTATPGDDQNCMNSICIKAQRNLHVFPHAVFAVSTIKTRVYIVDQLTDTGEFAHCVRYELSGKDSHLISDHDKYGSGEAGILTLRTPSDPKGSPNRAAAGGGRFRDGGGNGNNPGGHYDGSSNSRPVTGGTNHGATARYKIAVGALNLPDGKA